MANNAMSGDGTATGLNPQERFQRRSLLAILAFGLLGALTTLVIHLQWVDPSPMALMVPPLLAIASLTLFIRLCQQPKRLRPIAYSSLAVAVLLFFIPSAASTLRAFVSPTIRLVATFPPTTSCLFLLITGLLTILRPQRLLRAAIALWVITAVPILLYLFLHPEELATRRGLDLLISLGPAMGVQIAFIWYHSRVQQMMERLYTERLQYYSQIIERQTIRQQAMEQAFTQIHNGHLQTLTLLLRDVQRHTIPSQDLLQRLDALNAEIRSVGRSLTDEAYPEGRAATELTSLEPATSDQTLRLGEGTCIDLNRPLHHLFYEVYSLTLRRNLPHFATIRVKVRDFAPLQHPFLSLDVRRDLCLWLEEALCNVGKHAQGATRIVVTGKPVGARYVLRVQDNGSGLKPKQEQQGTQQSHALAARLNGTFRRESLPKGGVICELSWAIASSSET